VKCNRCIARSVAKCRARCAPCRFEPFTCPLPVGAPHE
jgi:hypothetical protein